ncbi:hypothetical protein FOB64_005052 [Candida albicans]|uniref:Uncharacterized protein n=1 Tax=Candida albicans TaxID=5476 RepID=A0A8H6F1G0_CANAX|nr:hypothetical protein FOB64_005052 [Candida albicans]
MLLYGTPIRKTNKIGKRCRTKRTRRRTTETTKNLSNLINFDSFSLHELIKCGTKLLASKSDDIDPKIIPMMLHYSEPIVKQEPGTQQQHDNLASASASPAPPTGSNKPVSSARLKAMQRRKAKANAKNGANKIRSVDISQSSLSRQMIENGEGMDIDSKDSTPQFDVTSTRWE